MTHTPPRVKIFTDGSSSNNGKPNCASGWATCFQINNRWYIRYGPNDDGKQQSNNRGEIVGVLYAALMLNQHQRLGGHVVSDSQYVIKSITEWSKKWRSPDRWENTNADLLVPLYEVWNQMGSRNQIEWCRGHTGIVGNELADQWSLKGRQRKEETVNSSLYDIRYVKWEEINQMMQVQNNGKW